MLRRPLQSPDGAAVDGRVRGRSVDAAGGTAARVRAFIRREGDERGEGQTLKLILTLAAAALVLVTAAVFAARLWWAFDLLTHFRLQYVVAALILGLAALAVRAYPAAAVLAAVALVHGWAIKDLWLGDGTTMAAAAAAGVPLRVASANVLVSNPTPEQVLAFVRDSDADLVVLVEARQPRWREVLRSIGALYPHRAPEGWRNSAPVILFSRHPILGERAVRPPGGRRPYLVAEIAVGERRTPVTVVAVHPSSPSPTEAADTRRRNRELAYIAESVEGTDRPVIVAGDFNTSPWSPHFRDLIAAAGLRNAAAGHGWIATWPSWFWPARVPIDHILVRGPLAVTAFARGPAIGSDHFPVVADLRLLGG